MLERERAAQFGIEQIPPIVLLKGDQDTRIRFLGAPAGYEFMSLIEAVILAGTNDSGLTPDSRALVAEHVTNPARHSGLRDTHVPALPARSDPGASIGGRKPTDYRVVRRSDRVHRSVAQVPRDRRSEDDCEGRLRFLARYPKRNSCERSSAHWTRPRIPSTSVTSCFRFARS